MKKRINGKRHSNKITYVVLVVFIIYITLSLSLIDRPETKPEQIFKVFASNINGYFIQKMYSLNNISDSLNGTRFTALQEENNNLRKILNLNSKYDYFVAAEVTIHNSKNWYDSIYINKGTNDNVTDNSVVINSDGAIGFVKKAYDNISEVDLLTGTYSGNLVSVLIETINGNISGIITKYDTNKKMYVVSDITSKDNIPPGSKVILYGYMDDRINGILVGYVAKEETDNYGLTKKVWVKTNVDFNDLMFVSVMVKKWYLQQLHFLYHLF